MERRREGTETVVIPIVGMHCASCVEQVGRALRTVEGVLDVRVNLATGQAALDIGDTLPPVEQLFAAVRGAGHDVQTKECRGRVEGMSCASCVHRVESALRGVRGVIDARVNLANGMAKFTFIPELTTADEMVRAVEEAGYRLFLEAEESPEVPETTAADLALVRRTRRRLVLAWGFTLPIVGIMLAEMLGRPWPSPVAGTLLMIALALPAVFGAGWETLGRGFAAVRRGRATMDTLISLGSVIAFLTGPLSLGFPVANYAGIAAMIMAFHLSGRYVEAKARGKASQAIRRLLELGARTARVLREGREVEVPVSALRVGDVMLIRPGEKIPTDGLVIEGETSVDESMATGESLPVAKGPGDFVIGGTISRDGFIKVRATRVGRDTFLAQVIRIVEECQTSRVPIQEFADRVTGVFVPVVLGIALLTLALWLAFPGAMTRLVSLGTFLPWVNPNLGPTTLAILSLVAVLVIACPCALGLATPTAIMVASGVGAGHGILIRSGEAIQLLRQVKMVVFDKTGTLTRGEPELMGIAIATGWREEEALQLAASAESGSAHPIAQAIVRAAERRGIELRPVADFRTERGRGVSASVDGRRVLVGNRAFLEEAGIDLQVLAPAAKEAEGKGRSPVFLAVDGAPVAVLAVGDQLRPEAKEVVGALRHLGIRTALITGDNRFAALAVADELEIDHVLAEVLPQQKSDFVRKLQQDYRPVAFVGDGINDAPALRQADVGIAIGSGTDVAIEASDVTLVRSDLRGVLQLLRLSRATFRKIRQNLFWAFFYNVIMIPAAMAGWMHPLLAELAMATSSITVVTNANLLRRLRLR
jgi:Cu+-exporting ATPase